MVDFLIGALEHIGGLGLLVRDTFRRGCRRPFEWGLWVDQLHHLGVGSTPIVLTTALFTGMVLALQTAASKSARISLRFSIFRPMTISL